VFSDQIALSVVTINKNNLNGLRKTSDSILQHLDTLNIEWILIDGGSTDGCSEFIESLNHLKIQKRFTTLGIYESMNLGASLSRGKYILFMNSGDRFTSSGIENASNLANESDVEWMVAGAVAVNSNYQPMWSWVLPSEKSNGFKYGFRSFCHQSTFVRRDVFNYIGGFQTDSLFSDWQVSLKLSKLFKPFRTDQKIAEYLVGGLSVQQTHRYWAMQICKLRADLYRIKFIGQCVEYPKFILLFLWKRLRHP